MKKSLLLLIPPLFALSAQLSHAATDPYNEGDNLIVNGDFEGYNTPPTHGAYHFEETGHYKAPANSGWDIGDPGLEIRNSYYGHDNTPGLNGHGSFASLDVDSDYTNNKNHSTNGSSNTNSWISQSFQTTKDREYYLTFDFSGSPNPAAQTPHTSQIYVWWGNDTAGNRRVGPWDAGTTITPQENIWGHSLTYTFRGTGGIDTIKFQSWGTPDNYGMSLDNIKLLAGASLNPPPSPVPIPATALLFAPALLGFIGLRRKAKKVLPA